jgi:predicted pyridoxine 5'-phosphate oxidase superfamily flavin-nucleotide-binding protein
VSEAHAPRLADLSLCFEGVVPAVIATVAADGTPNVTYLSCVRAVDRERIALSNQFFSKTARNLAEVPRASVLVIDPTTYDEYRLAVVYERTERRGPVFEALREDVEVVAALSGMEDVFTLRAADVYRVVDVELVRTAVEEGARERPPRRDRPAPASFAKLAELSARLSRCPNLDVLVDALVRGLAELLGYEHSLLLLLDEEGRRLFTIASHGYEAEGVGSEVTVGEGVVGMAAARAAPMRLGNLRQMHKYSRSIRESFEERGDIGPGREIPVPGLRDADSRVAVPAMALGQLVGVLVVESTQPLAFSEDDEALLTAIASIVANAVEAERAQAATEDPADVAGTSTPAPAPASTAAPVTHVRFFDVDGSTFVDGDYLIKGVAGRILWSLLNHYARDGRVDFTNREVRLDPSLELPEFRDNLESRLILLKRRLDERDAQIRIEKTGRGRFRLSVGTALDLEAVSAT